MAATGVPLPQISALIQDRQQRRGRDVCLLIGAGADISSGGVTFAQFKRDFYALVLGRPMAGANDPAIAREVDAFLSRTSEPEIRARLVEATFDIARRRQPSDSYLLLALALEKIALDAVITTNFDVMLEAAEQSLGLSVLRVYARGIAMPDDTDARVREANRVPYLKLHGCLNGRTITHITDHELGHGNYAAPFRAFLKHRLADADLIVSGYSGSDSQLARLIGTSLKNRASRVYWCNPRPPIDDAPLVKAVGRHRLVHMTATFQEVVEAIARPVLETPTFTTARPIFIPCLLDWRVACASRDYLASHAYRGHRSIRELLVRRRSVETHLGHFLESDKPMTIVAGPSGVGKSALGVRLVEHYSEARVSAVLPIAASSIPVGRDFGEHLASQVGGLGARTPFSFAEFELWLRRSGRRLIVCVDALNEHAVALDHVASLLRDIVRFCYFLPQRSSIRTIVTVRQETWNRLCDREDKGRLAAVCWSPHDMPGTISAIQLGPLTDVELEEALDVLCHAIGKPSIYRHVPAQTRERLRDPYLLAAISDAVLQAGDTESVSWIHGPALGVVDRVFRTRLARNYADQDAETLTTVLARAAFTMIERNEDHLRHLDLSPNGAQALVPMFKDLGILTDTSDGRLRFSHERTHEYFLSKALELPDCPFSLRTPEGLSRVLKEFDNRHQLIAAIRSFFLRDPSTRFSLVADVVSKSTPLPDAQAEYRLLAFAKELMIELATDSPRDFQVWFNRARHEVEAVASGDTTYVNRAAALERHWRAMIQAATHLPDLQSLAALTEAATTGTTLARTEAEIYATDKIVRLLLERGGGDLLNDAPFASYYADVRVSRLKCIGRVLGLVSQIGPDNTHPDEYAVVRARAETACTTLLMRDPLTDTEIDWFAHFIYAERDRYLFNGNLEGMQRFFRNPGRAAFLPIFDRLERGDVLQREDVETLRPYIVEIYQDFEFQLGNFLFMFSAANDLARTQALWEEYFDSFDDSTPPEMVDFFQAVVTYMYVVNGYEDDGMLGRHIDRILSECPRVVEYAPGRQRGYGRGFTDEFDMVFEDGFNPVANYATLVPSRERRSLRWHEYDSRPPKAAPLPVYTKHLAEALSQGETTKALRLIHALGQFITLWPREGLWHLIAPLQYDHPLIHRAAVRVLAEAYNRSPLETLRFLANDGVSLSPGDWRDVRARIDPRTGRRQFEGLQWGRVLHFLLSIPGGRPALFRALRAFYTASSAREAIQTVVDASGWTKNKPSR